MTPKNIFIIGGGGREHVIAWSLSKSPKAGKIFCAPGNGGMSLIGSTTGIDLSNHGAVARFAKDNKVELVVIGPEAPLVDGLSDSLRKEGLVVLGAGQAAAQLEGSKIFAKNFMNRYGIPTANFRTFKSPEDASRFARSPEGKAYRILKADGLAAGKGVFVCEDQSAVLQAIQTVMVEKKFGGAGDKILLEEKLTGPEISVIALTDGRTIFPFTASQDHKRAYDGDLGPNTGGMGAYAPTPFYDETARIQIEKTIIEHFLNGIQSEKLDYRGFIYFGLMLTPQGPKVLEFNVRLGDPEAQVVLPLIESDLYDLFTAAANGELESAQVAHRKEFACTVVLASGGYPGAYQKGYEIFGLNEAAKKPGVVVFHAGTQKTENGGFVSTGGRVLNVTGTGNSLDQAVVRAYQAVKKIHFKDCFFRNDIGARALENKNLTQRIKRMKKRYAKEIART